MLLSKLLSRTTFDSYADFKKNYELRVPARFNFARDVVDAWAEADPRKRALVWLNDRGERREFTFAEISELSKKAANYLSSLGLKKGDRILTLLKRNWQYWVTAVACHRMGCSSSLGSTPTSPGPPARATRVCSTSRTPTPPRICSRG